MQTPESYITKTESAVRKLFEGIESYVRLLEPTRGTMFVTSQSDRMKRRAELDTWREQNQTAVMASEEAWRKFSEESFAMAVLCGAVLQIAAKAIEIYSTNADVPVSVEDIIENNIKLSKFCIGREVYSVPIGLIIYAGRNQHAHFNEPELYSVNEKVFERLRLHLGAEAHKYFMFDRANPLANSWARDITYILGWRSYEAYVADLRDLLKDYSA